MLFQICGLVGVTGWVYPFDVRGTVEMAVECGAAERDERDMVGQPPFPHFLTNHRRAIPLPVAFQAVCK